MKDTFNTFETQLDESMQAPIVESFDAEKAYEMIAPLKQEHKWKKLHEMVEMGNIDMNEFHKLMLKLGVE